MFNFQSKKPTAPAADANREKSLNLAADSSTELQRLLVSPSAGLPQDSAVIPNIEDWLKGRSKTGEREILQNTFDDEAYRT